MNLGEWIQYTIWDIKGRFGDKDAASHAQALWEVTHGTTATDRDIQERVESASKNFKHTGFLGVLDSVGDTVRGFAKGVTSILGFSLKNIQWIVLLAVVGYFGWLFVNMRKGTGK